MSVQIEQRLAEFCRGDFPFRFVYDGIDQRRFSGTWERREDVSRLDGRVKKTVTLSDAATGLVVTCELSFFHEYPAAEWIVFFENSGTKSTPIIENVKALDLLFDRPLPGETSFILHQTNGALTTPEDLMMQKVPLTGNDSYTMGGQLGMPSAADLPYFRLDMQSASVIIAVGWSGQWRADFECLKGEKLQVTAGMEKTRFRLHPGEKVRSPRMLMLLWEGQGWESNVQFRRLLYEHYVPKFRGKRPDPFVIFDTYDVVGLDEATEANQLALVDTAKALEVEIFFTDAGWFEGGYPAGAGNWKRVRKECYPNGFGGLAKACADSGMVYGLWFDPERVIAGTEVAVEHPQWLLWKNAANSAKNVLHVYSPEVVEAELAQLGFTRERGRTPEAFIYHRENVEEYHGDEKTAMLNFGLAQVQDYYFQIVDELMQLPGFQGYRHDMNVTAPLLYFESNDEPDRQGITEMKYFQGLYACWDRIRAGHPECFINTDHRLDLECVMRSHVIQMSDSGGNNVNEQSSLFSISHYIPNGSIMAFVARVDADDYTFHSSLASSPLLRFKTGNLESDSGFAKVRARIDQYLAIRHLLNGDWYPLTEYSRTSAQWLGSQYHRPDLDEGVLLVYRRECCEAESLTVQPQMLSSAGMYTVTSLAGGRTETVSGTSLLKGYEVVIPQRPGSDVIRYRKER